MPTTRPSSTAMFAAWISPLSTLTSFAFLNSNSAGCSPRAMLSFCDMLRILVKLQNPSSKFQRSPKFQVPNRKCRKAFWSCGPGIFREPEFWRLGFSFHCDRIIQRGFLFLDGHENGFTRCRNFQEHFAARGSEGGDGIANRFAHGDGEHQRRFAHGFAAVDGEALRGVFEKAHVELARAIANGGNFICVRRVREQAAFLIPNKFLAREPTGALHESPFDLAEINAGIY